MAYYRIKLYFYCKLLLDKEKQEFPNRKIIQNKTSNNYSYRMRKLFKKTKTRFKSCLNINN